MKANRSGHRIAHHGRCVVLACAALFLVACGGGGGSSGSAPQTAPPTTAAQINSSNYLLAAAIGLIGRNRAIDLATQIDLSFLVGLERGFASGSYTCPGGGTAELTASSASANTLAFSNCSVSPAIYKSGSIAVTGLQTTTVGTPPNTSILLSQGTYRITELVTRSLGGDGVDQTFNAALVAQRQADSSALITGIFSVLRNGRTDAYVNLSENAFKSGGSIVSLGMSFDVSSPRLAVQPLRVVTAEGATPSVRVAAPDGSYVRMTYLSLTPPAQIRFELFPNATAASPSVSQTLTETDPAVIAAVIAALQ